MGLSSVHADTLAQLGTERLAELLVEEAARNPHLERRLQSLLAYSSGPDARVRYVRDRLERWRQAKGEVARRRPRELARELAHDRRTLVEGLTPDMPDTAVRLLLEFLDLHRLLLDAIDDAGGLVTDVFDAACADLGLLAERATIAADELAEAACRRLVDDPYGVYDGLVSALQPALGDRGLALIETELRRRLHGAPPGTRNDVSPTKALIAARLREVADLRGDVDTYRETLDEADLRNPKTAAGLAARLTDAGRAEEAIEVLGAAPPTPDNGYFGELDWATARVAALEAAGYSAEAQDIRLGSFPSTPSAAHLKAYLTRLDERFERNADDIAMDFVGSRPNGRNALAFLVSWLAHQHPARLVLARSPAQGDQHEQLLLPAARALESDHPLASIVLRRALVEDALVWSRPERYPDAARQVRSLDRLDGEIAGYEAFETHDQFLHRLRREHPHKARFWSLLHRDQRPDADDADDADAAASTADRSGPPRDGGEGADTPSTAG
jgi:hypothetical protein